MSGFYATALRGKLIYGGNMMVKEFERREDMI